MSGLIDTPQYLLLVPGGDPPALERKPTRVVVVADQLVEPGWQDLVSRWLVEIGCRYMLAWGPGCSSWDDSVDFANSEAFGYGDIPEEFDVVTTWHADEALAECMWSAKNCAMHPKVDLERTVILHIGLHGQEREMLDAYAEA